MSITPLLVDTTSFLVDSSLITVDMTEADTETGSLFFNDATIAFNDASITWNTLGDVVAVPVATAAPTRCTPLRFGVANTVPTATLEATPAPNTNLEWLKNEWQARRVIWSGEQGDIVIDGEIPELQIGEYFSLPGSNLLGQAQVKMELFNDIDSSLDVLNMPFVQIAEPIPLGQWRTVIDPYGVPREIDRPSVFLYWFDKPLAYKRFRLTIQRSEYADKALSDVSLRMLIIGQMIEMDYSFSAGNLISFLTQPQLIQTGGGSWIPSRAQTRSRTMSLSLKRMSNSDRARLWEMESTLQGQPFMVSSFPAEDGWKFSNYSFLARFSNSLEFNQKFKNIHSVANLNMVEV